VNVGANQVLDQLCFESLRVVQVDDADGHGSSLGHLCGTISPGSGDDLEAVLSERPYQQRRKDSLGADALGILWR
jgi:hypothetical protein